MVREMDFVDECYADKDLSLLKKLTLVIPTYNRNYYLSRCLWYHAHFPFGQIIVADSSPEEKKVVNRETVAKVREMFGADILYLEYEPETEKYGGDIYRKWGDAVMHVETEYSQICTDKEFVIPTTQCECVNYLDQNLEYGVCSGKYYTVEKLLNTPFLFSRYNMRSTENHPSAQVRHASNFLDVNNAHLLSLYRSKIHQYIYSVLLNHPGFDLRFGERYLEYTIYLCSKVYYLDQKPFNIRDLTELYDNGIAKLSESSTLRYPSYDSYDKSSEEYMSMYESFRLATLEVIVGLNILDSVSAANYFEETISHKILRHKYLQPQSSLVQSLLVFFGKISPKIVNILWKILIRSEKHVNMDLKCVLRIIGDESFGC